MPGIVIFTPIGKMMTNSKTNSTRGILIACGVICILLSVVILGASLWEAFGGIQNKFHSVTLPGFHDLELKDRGLYGGVYQHRGTGPLPIKQIVNLDVRIIHKDSYQEIGVLMNTTGQVFDRMGVRGIPVFNFAVEHPGSYSISGIYRNGEGPTLPIMIFSQAAQNIKQTLTVGIFSFVMFLSLGIVVLVKVKKWAP